MNDLSLHSTISNLYSRIEDARNKIASIVYKFKYDSQFRWSAALEEIIVLSNQLQKIANEIAKIQGNFIIEPEKLDPTMKFSIDLIPDLLRTKIEPEIEDEEKKLIQEGSNILVEDQTNLRIQEYNEMCETLQDYYTQLVPDDFKRKSKIDTTQTNSYPEARAKFWEAMMNGTFIKPPPPPPPKPELPSSKSESSKSKQRKDTKGKK